MNDEENETSLLLLCDRKEEFFKKVAFLIPEANLQLELEKQPKAAKICFSVKLLVLSLIIFIASYQFLLIGIILVMIVLLIGICSYCAKGILLKDNQIFLSTGVFDLKIYVLSPKKIQHLKINDGPLTRSFGIQKMHIFVLASKMDSFSTGYFSKEIVKQICSRLTTKG